MYDALSMDYGGATDEDRKRALMPGLLAAGLAMLGVQKGREMEGLSRAGLLGMGVHNQYLRDTATERIRNMGAQKLVLETKQMQQKMAEDQRINKGLEAARIGATTSFPSYGPPTESGEMSPAGQTFDVGRYVQGVMGIDPMRGIALQQAMGKELPFDKPKPEHYTPDSLAKYVASRNVADLVAVPKEKDQWEPIGKTPDGQIIQRNTVTGQLQAVGSPGQRVAVNMPPMENEEQKGIGKARAEAFVSYGQAARQASAKIESLNAIDALIGNVATGALTPIGMKAAGVAKSLGVDIDPNLDRKQAAEAVGNKLALEARSTGEGGGMPGAMSDKDREFLVAMNPNLSQTEEGRKLLVNVLKRVSRRQQEMAALAANYRAQKGSFDEGFQAVADEYSRAHPLFDDLRGQVQKVQQPSGLTAAETIELERLRRRFGRSQ